MQLHRDLLEGPMDESTPQRGIVDAVLGIGALGVHVPHGGDDALLAVDGPVGQEGKVDFGPDDPHQGLAPDSAGRLVVELLRPFDVNIRVARL